MKVAIDISPLQSGHKVRGVGFYLTYLKKEFEQDSRAKFTFFTYRSSVPKDVDIVHYPYFEPFFVTLPFFEQHKRIVTIHDLTPLVFPEHFPAGIKGNLSWQIQRLNLIRSDGIITDSLSSKKDIAKYAGIAEEKIHVVYLAAGEEFREVKIDNVKQKVLQKYNLPEKFVLYVGDVTWNKNLPRLIGAMKELNIPLVMVGKSLVQKDFDKTNSWNKDLVEVQKLTNDDSRFIKLGFVPTEDLVVLYNIATVFVFPSLYEGFGLPILEAMQCGCPVVTTREGSLPEVAGEAAYYVDAYDRESIAKGVSEVYLSKKLQEQLSEKGKDQAKKFSWRKTAEETIQVYKKSLGK
jgi:glycosyltransferase involved in cell wall biosynthesis